MTVLMYVLIRVVAIAILVIFSLITAYVFKFGIKNSGIHFDYILFALFVLLALWRGGAI